MNNGWTGGQFSLLRGALGAFLLVCFVRMFFLIDAEVQPAAMAAVLLALGVVAAGALLIGFLTRAAAGVLLVLIGGLLGALPGDDRGLLIFAPVLLITFLLPAAPFGSLAAFGRLHPGGGWSYGPQLYRAAWIFLALAYCSTGIGAVMSPAWREGSTLMEFCRVALDIELSAAVARILSWIISCAPFLFVPLALLSFMRRLIWIGSLMTILTLALVAPSPLAFWGLVFLQLFTFDPHWIRRSADGSVTVFYDGHCGLCHGLIRFLCAEDIRGVFLFAPLHAKTFEAAFSEEERAHIPDSVVVLAADKQVRYRFAAVLQILAHLGGLWRLMAWILWPVPRLLGDALYSMVAKVRGSLFKRPEGLCPVLPAELRHRLLE